MATKRPSSILRVLRLIALAATFLGSTNLVSTVVFYNSSFPTQGIILDFAQTDEAFSSGRTPIIAFTDYQNQKHFATPLSAVGSAYYILGQKRPIRYVRDSPEVFRIDTLIGMWGSGVIGLLYGLVPFVLLSVLISANRKGAPTRKSARKRQSTLGVKHLVDHTQSLNDTDKPVVRRMR